MEDDAELRSDVTVQSESLVDQERASLLVASSCGRQRVEVADRGKVGDMMERRDWGWRLRIRPEVRQASVSTMDT